MKLVSYRNKVVNKVKLSELYNFECISIFKNTYEACMGCDINLNLYMYPTIQVERYEASITS